ncbi:MAG TPA: GNAT family N-acetyltransferase [Thermoleophilaceae bacterium]|nr:GNAT family N-acetyltransferase [Thermoleophilaceae bacterium]
MIDRVLESMFHWYRLVGGASDGARVLELDGVVAAVVPAAPERAVVNAVLFRSAPQLEAAYDEIASAYREIGAKWTVWVPPGEDGDAAGRFLESRGHLLDAKPVAMLHDLENLQPPSHPDSISDGRVEEVGQVNDQAYTFGTDSFSRALQTLPDGAVHIYVFRHDGRPVGCMTSADHEGNTEVQMVAVVPEARGRGIAGDLLRQALADAAERGSETASLVATKMGSPVYEREGFRALDQLSMWERRSASLACGAA